MIFLWIASILWAVISAVFCLAICLAAKREIPEMVPATPLRRTEAQRNLQLTADYPARGIALETPRQEPPIARSSKTRSREKLRKGRASGNHRHQHHGHQGYQFSQS